MFQKIRWVLAIALLVSIISIPSASPQATCTGCSADGLRIFGETDLIQNSTNTTVPTFDVTDCSNASPIVVTTGTNHGMANGEWAVIEDVTGNTACNGFF